MLLTLRGGPKSLAPRAHRIPVYPMVFSTFLYRACTAHFGLEAAIAALPPGTTGGRGEISKRLRNFALTVPQITELRWQQAGELRHTLFHGGITETSKSSEMVLRASPIARLVLIAALRTALGLPLDGTPELPRLPDGYATNDRMEVNTIWRGQPPDAL